MSLGIVIQKTKGDMKGTPRVLEDLDFIIDTEQMWIFVSVRKIEKVQSLARKFLLLAQRNIGLILLELVRHFCRICVSLWLTVPLARFYTRSLYFDMGLAEKKEKEREAEPEKTKIASAAG